MSFLDLSQFLVGGNCRLFKVGMYVCILLYRYVYISVDLYTYVCILIVYTCMRVSMLHLLRSEVASGGRHPIWAQGDLLLGGSWDPTVDSKMLEYRSGRI